MTTQIAKRRKTGDLIQPEQRPVGLQAIFDRVVAASRSQPEQSLDDCGECCYRGENDLRCFVGHMIPDEHYSKTMEGSTACDVLGALGFADDEIALLDALQQIHDSHEPDEWESQFTETAGEYGLVHRALQEGC